jgi:hypothetical protein
MSGWSCCAPRTDLILALHWGQVERVAAALMERRVLSGG